MQRVHPPVVIGVPLYNRAEHLPAAVDSLLGQSYGDFALLLVDDASSDATQELAAGYAAQDERVTYFRHPQRLGMIENWRRCVELASKRYPDARYFAWGSDHDRWHEDWLDTLVAELDRDPRVVLAYPLTVPIDDPEGIQRQPGRFETLGERRPHARVRDAAGKMFAGTMVYGLYRREALQRAGTFRRVLQPDRLLLLELALLGEFRQVPRVLWERRFEGLYSVDRQRAALFAGGRPPLHAFLAPWWLTHSAVFAWLYVARGGGLPHLGRLSAAGVCWDVLRITAARRLRRQRALAMKQLRRRARRSRRWCRLQVQRLRRLVRGVVIPDRNSTDSW